MYMSSADLPLIHYATFSMVGGYMKNLQKKQNNNCQNCGVGACARMGARPGQYGMFVSILDCHLCYLFGQARFTVMAVKQAKSKYVCASS